MCENTSVTVHLLQFEQHLLTLQHNNQTFLNSKGWRASNHSRSAGLCVFVTAVEFWQQRDEDSNTGTNQVQVQVRVWVRIRVWMAGKQRPKQLTIWQGMCGNGQVIYCRADKGKWKQVSRWMWESGDWDRWKSLRTFGGQVEKGHEGGLWNWKCGWREGQRGRMLPIYDTPPHRLKYFPHCSIFQIVTLACI